MRNFKNRISAFLTVSAVLFSASACGEKEFPITASADSGTPSGLAVPGRPEVTAGAELAPVYFPGETPVMEFLVKCSEVPSVEISKYNCEIVSDVRDTLPDASTGGRILKISLGLKDILTSDSFTVTVKAANAAGANLWTQRGTWARIISPAMDFSVVNTAGELLLSAKGNFPCTAEDYYEILAEEIREDERYWNERGMRERVLVFLSSS